MICILNIINNPLNKKKILEPEGSNHQLMWTRRMKKEIVEDDSCGETHFYPKIGKNLNKTVILKVL